MLQKYYKWRIARAERELQRIDRISEQLRVEAAKQFKAGKEDKGNKILQDFFMLGACSTDLKIKINKWSTYVE